MVDIISPIQEDSLLLTPQQREALNRQKVESFKVGLAELEEKTGMTLAITLRYLPTGIFPAGAIIPLMKKPTAEKPPAPPEVPPAPKPNPNAEAEKKEAPPA